MRGAILLLACLPALCSSRFTCGPVEFEAGPDGIIVLYHGHEWKPDISRLPIRPNDCPDDAARKECQAHPGAACLACINEWLPIAWDELNEILYFSASRIILGYDLRSEQINRIVDIPAGPSYDPAVVSPTGRYLALVSHSSCDTCCPSSYLTLIDTQTRKMDSFHLPDIAAGEAPKITSVHWAGSSALEYSADIHRDQYCKSAIATPLRKITGAIPILSPRP